MIYSVEFAKGADGLPGLMTIVDVLTAAPTPSEAVEFAAALMQVDETGISLQRVSEIQPVDQSGQPCDLPGVYETHVVTGTTKKTEHTLMVSSRTAWDGFAVAAAIAALQHPAGKVTSVVWRPEGDAYGVAVSGDTDRIVIVHAPTSVAAVTMVERAFPDRDVLEVAGIIDGLGTVTEGHVQTSHETVAA